jgi:glycerophosphoryl diester phosphodiesterase
MPHRRCSIMALAAIVVAISVYLLNASWLAARPAGRPSLVAQRGVHQVFDPRGVDNDTCTATRIPPPTHELIDNTLPSIAAAFNAGADVVEADVRETRDREFVLFHDLTLDCRTDGHGPVGVHILAELRRLDVGFGYTADGGRTYPLRGKGVGQMATLEEALRAFPDRRFLIQFKDGAPSTADDMVRYLEARGLADWGRLSFFGKQGAIRRLVALRPQARTWTDKGTFGCAAGYLAVGWSSYVPKSCRRGVIIVPANLSGLMWGWPNRFLERMRRNDAQVLMIGDMTRLPGADFSRLDSVDQLRKLPAGFDGSIWTDHIERIGPAAQRRWGMRRRGPD